MLKALFKTIWLVVRITFFLGAPIAIAWLFWLHPGWMLAQSGPMAASMQKEPMVWWLVICLAAAIYLGMFLKPLVEWSLPLTIIAMVTAVALPVTALVMVPRAEVNVAITRAALADKDLEYMAYCATYRGKPSQVRADMGSEEAIVPAFFGGKSRSRSRYVGGHQEDDFEATKQLIVFAATAEVCEAIKTHAPNALDVQTAAQVIAKLNAAY